MSTHVAIQNHDTAPELFDALARVFVVHEQSGTRWVTFTVDGVRLTFFAERQDDKDEDDDAA